ncbi:MAG: AcrR family transcriptional regulator [Candidatus Aldehydirespiratoraceae bacterium]|jgi:AcrR family transcriptional regulator
MESVAVEAGVTKPVLYQHFSSKRELFLELLRHVGVRLSYEVGEAATAASTGQQKVIDGFSAYFQFVASHPDEFRLLFGEGVRSDPEFAQAVADVEGQLVQFIAALIDIPELSEGDRLLLAHGILGLAESTGRHWIAGGAVGDVGEFAGRVADLAWLGLRGRQP